MLYKLLIIALVAAATATSNTDASAESGAASSYQQHTIPIQPATAIVRGSLEQIRRNPSLEIPLTSLGTFTFWKNQGFYWQLDSPVFSAYTFLKNEVIVWRDANTRADLQPPAAVKQIGWIINTIFHASPEHISRFFSTQVVHNASHWRASLKPIRRPLKKHVAEIKIHGDANIRNISIALKNGSSIKMQFDNLIFLTRPDATTCRQYLNVCSDAPESQEPATITAE